MHGVSLLPVNFENFVNFFISHTFISKIRLKLAKKNQAKAKQHSKAELLLFQNYSLLHPRYHPKLKYSEICCKKQVCLF